MGLPKIKLAGGGERFQYLVHEYNDNTIRFVLNYPGILDVDALRGAIKAVVESVDILHGTFFSDPVNAYWSIHENVDEHNYFHYLETAGDPAITAYCQSLLPVYPEDKVQLHCTLVQSHCASSLVIRISHLCVDGGDGKYLLQKLMEAYNRILETGNADGLTVKNGNRAPEQVYGNLNAGEIKSLLTNPVFSVKTEYPFPTKETGRSRVIRRVIPADVMAKARVKAKETGATVNDLLLTACYRAYAALDSVDSGAAMSVTSMMDLRRHCKDGESDGLCNMSGSMPTTLENGVSGSFADTLAEIVHQTTAAKENPLAGLEGLPILHGATRTLPIGLLLKIAGKVYGSMSVGLTNLGNINCRDYALGNLVPTGGMFGGPLKKKPGMQVSVMSFDGECVLCIVGQYTNEDAVMLQGTLDLMVQEVYDYANG